MLETATPGPLIGAATQPASGLARWAAQGFNLPFAADIPHQLGEELSGLSPNAQHKLGWRIWKRHAWLHLSGHARHLRLQIPTTATKLLWIYTWTTLGDAVMDLSARHLFPDTMAVDLHIAPQLAGLFEADPRFHRVHHTDDVDPSYDFVILQDLHAASLRLKHQLAPRAPFASMLGYLHGEMFHRVVFAHQRLAQLLGQADPLLQPPRLHGIAPQGIPLQEQACARIAIALGARDARRRYAHWPSVLRHLLGNWPAQWPLPRFILLGNGNAHEDFATLAQAGLLPYCELHLSCPSLGELAQVIASCDAFVGADGGPMHLALALQRPGVALFGPVPAHLRLLSGSSLTPVASTHGINHIDPAHVAGLALSQLVIQGASKRRWLQSAQGRPVPDRPHSTRT